MPLETTTYISGLDTANPTSGDGLNQGDDHIRLLKSTIKATFPSVTGAVTGTHTQLNNVVARIGNSTTAAEARTALEVPSTTEAAAAVPTYSGAVLQAVTSTDAGGSTTSTSLINVTAAALTITPLASASKLLIEASFDGRITNVTATNTTAGFRLYEITGSPTALGSEITLGTVSGGGGVGAEAPCTIRATVTNTGTTARSFVLYAKSSIATATAYATLLTLSATEIKT